MRHTIGVVLVMFLAACGAAPGQRAGRPSSPTAPSFAAEPSREPIPPAATRGVDISTIFGFAYEHTAAGIYPLANFPLRVRGYRSEPSTYTPVTLNVVTDSTGRYEVPRMMREFAMVTIQPQDAYLSPCSARLWLWSDRPINVHVVSKQSFFESGIPSSMPPLSKRVGDEQGDGYEAVSGAVTERTPDGVRPVSGALVQHFYGNDEFGDLTGYTVTNADGYYTLCGYDDDYGKVVRVTKKGYRPAVQSLGWPKEIDFELVRENSTGGVSQSAVESASVPLQ